MRNIEYFRFSIFPVASLSSLHISHPPWQLRPNTSLSSDLLRSSGQSVPEEVLSVALEMYDSVLTTDSVSKLDLQASVFRIGVATFT